MRRGLLAVGAAMAIVGASVVVAVALPFGSAAQSKTDRVWQPTVGADGVARNDFSTAPAGSAAVSFNWSASIATQVWWYAEGPCPPPSPPKSWCIVGAPLDSWSSNTSGHWAGYGTPATAYGVLVQDPASTPVNFSGEFVESYSGSAHRLPMVPFLLIVGGGGLLAGIGGLAIYLGLFLPSGVYADQLPGREPDDWDGPDDRPPAH